MFVRGLSTQVRDAKKFLFENNINSTKNYSSTETNGFKKDPKFNINYQYKALMNKKDEK